MTATVLQVLPSLVSGGVERGTIEIAEAIVEAGGRALVASSGGGLVTKLEQVGGQHITLPMDSKDPFVIWSNARRLEKLVRDEHVDILHARSRAPAWSAIRAAERTQRHFVTTFHATYNADFPGKHKYNSVMARGERVIAISEYIAGHIARHYPGASGRVRVIPRGADIRVFDPAVVSAERVEQLRAAWQLPSGRPIVMLPARLARWKGHGVLIEAIQRLGPEPLALLVGDGSSHYRDALEAQIEVEELEDRVKLVGHVHDMAAALLLADVVVHASTDPEAFGRTVVEAQAMGKPVIASDLGAPRETVQEGVTGWRVPPGDPEALAARLRQVLAMPAEARAAIGALAQRQVRERYTVQAMQEATLAVYRELL